MKNYKDKLALWTACISFSLGWILTIINFFVSPMGEISDSTLWVLGQALLYCGGVIGITQYVKGEIKDIKQKVGIENE